VGKLSQMGKDSIVKPDDLESNNFWNNPRILFKPIAVDTPGFFLALPSHVLLLDHDFLSRRILLNLCAASPIRARSVTCNLSTGTGTHLFVKVPRSGDSEVTFSVFESSYHLLLPV